MIPHIDIPVAEPSQVGEARRAASRLASDQRLDKTVVGRVAIIVTELGNNLWRHATKGRLLIGCRKTDAGCQLEVISIDSGPGMSDISRCLRDGYSTGGMPGTGLGAVQCLSTDFSAFSYAGICVAASGEVVSGDAWDIRVEDGHATVIVADGLGHGPVAAEAASEALKVFESARGSPAAILERAHPLMRGTRGAAVTLATVDANAGTITYAGAGNISAASLRASKTTRWWCCIPTA